MAPDLNSVPSSPRQQQRVRTSQPPSTSNSRRPSQVMAQSGTSPAMHHSPVFAHSEHGMPVRHPRPLTAAELHLELEKEQEAVVNRLTRELTALRAQHSASVASNHSLSSTTSTPLIDPTDPNPAHQITGPTHPTPSRRHRSSSSSISRSGTNPNSTSTSTTHPPPHGQSQASADRAAAATTRSSVSRNPSISASGTSTPARISSDTYSHSYTNAPGGLTLPHRPALSHAGSAMSGISVASTAATQGSGTGSATSTAGTPVGSLGLALAGAGGGTSAPPIPGPGISSPSFIDAEKARQELETVKIENEALREKVKALERQLRRRRESGTSEAMSVSAPGQVASTPASVLGTGTGAGAGERIAGPGGVNVSAWAAAQGSVAGVAGPRERSESQSTEASVRRRQVEGGMGETTQEERDEVVGVGESAGSKGVR
ncbi:hypothetical protein BDZ85DRAFT_315846 [Elsinoe ampelina]|uniref:Uncharacterized protein n=1 Tax=Elsinoe ampelina TaxID=302913 RepID=A0A6A6GL58_9PEZI|nr:hypothetical protein BDZ85DRAFT_315846 [Elsinoe ampelina]